MRTSLGYVPRNRIVGCIWNFTNLCQIAFQSECTNLKSHHQCRRVPTVLYPQQHLVLSDFKTFANPMGRFLLEKNIYKVPFSLLYKYEPICFKIVFDCRERDTYWGRSDNLVDLAIRIPLVRALRSLLGRAVGGSEIWLVTVNVGI